MQLVPQMRGETLVVRVGDARLDAAVAIRFKDEMRRMAERPAGRLILDLSKVQFLDSSGLGAVVAVMKLLAPDRTLELSGLTPNVQKVFRLTRMDSVFTIHPALPDLPPPAATGRDADRPHAG